jgi:RNA polymerase sigma factor (sigma-70 family)
MATRNSQQSLELKNLNSSTKNQKNNLCNAAKKQNKELEEELIHDHYGLVVSQALYFLNDANFDDYMQVGLIGLLKAIREHDPEKSKFSTFATICIRNAINNLKQKQDKKDSIKFEYAKVKEGFYHISEKISDCLPDFLSEEHKFIIKLKSQNYTNSEIADLISCTKEAVRQEIDLIIKSLRETNL